MLNSIVKIVIFLHESSATLWRYDKFCFYFRCVASRIRRIRLSPHVICVWLMHSILYGFPYTLINCSSFFLINSGKNCASPIVRIIEVLLGIHAFFQTDAFLFGFFYKCSFSHGILSPSKWTTMVFLKISTSVATRWILLSILNRLI